MTTRNIKIGACEKQLFRVGRISLRVRECTQVFKQRICFCLGIESHFVGVHGPYELHRKEKQIKCTALAVHENLLFFPMQFIWPVNTDKIRFNTYIYIF